MLKVCRNFKYKLVTRWIAFMSRNENYDIVLSNKTRHTKCISVSKWSHLWRFSDKLIYRLHIYLMLKFFLNTVIQKLRVKSFALNFFPRNCEIEHKWRMKRSTIHVQRQCGFWFTINFQQHITLWSQYRHSSLIMQNMREISTGNTNIDLHKQFAQSDEIFWKTIHVSKSIRL